MSRVIVAAATAGALGLACGGFAYASRWPTSQIFGRTLVAGKDPRDVALTFDDGPNDTATAALLDVLARHEVRATFFMMGSYARQWPDLVRRVVAEGHLLANHTMSHPKLSLTGLAQVRRELAECSAVLEDIAGMKVRYFRPPFGARRPSVLRVARELGLTPVMWNVTGYDWDPIGADGIVANVQRGIARNRGRGCASNVLLHDGGHRGMGASRLDTVGAVERVVAMYAGPGTRFVTVDQWGG